MRTLSSVSTSAGTAQVDSFESELPDEDFLSLPKSFMRSFLLYLAISLLTLVLISSSSTALAQSEHLDRVLWASGVVKLSGL